MFKCSLSIRGKKTPGNPYVSIFFLLISSEPIPLTKVKGTRKIKDSSNIECTVFSAALVKADLAEVYE